MYCSEYTFTQVTKNKCHIVYITIYTYTYIVTCTYVYHRYIHTTTCTSSFTTHRTSIRIHTQTKADNVWFHIQTRSANPKTFISNLKHLHSGLCLCVYVAVSITERPFVVERMVSRQTVFCSHSVHIGPHIWRLSAKQTICKGTQIPIRAVNIDSVSRILVIYWMCQHKDNMNSRIWSLRFKVRDLTWTPVDLFRKIEELFNRVCVCVCAKCLRRMALNELYKKVRAILISVRLICMEGCECVHACGCGQKIICTDSFVATLQPSILYI